MPCRERHFLLKLWKWRGRDYKLRRYWDAKFDDYTARAKTAKISKSALGYIMEKIRYKIGPEYWTYTTRNAFWHHPLCVHFWSWTLKFSSVFTVRKRMFESKLLWSLEVQPNTLFSSATTKTCLLNVFNLSPNWHPLKQREPRKKATFAKIHRIARHCVRNQNAFCVSVTVNLWREWNVLSWRHRTSSVVC